MGRPPKSVRVRRMRKGVSEQDPEYRGTRGIPWEAGGPPSKPKYYPVTDSV